ncbi:MAG: S8 family serine peptidase, partial [Bacteroidales bacterium]
YYGCSAGTSNATPIVAGVCGLMKSVRPSITPAQAQEIIKKTADPINDAYLYPNGVGAGRINAYCAVYHSEPLNLTGTLSGDYERYFTNLNNTIINSGTVNIRAAEVTIEGTFEVNTGVTLLMENTSSFSCP